MSPENFSGASGCGHCGCGPDGQPIPSLRDGTCGSIPDRCVVRDCSGVPFNDPNGELCRLDVNKDGYIDARDSQLIKNYLNQPGSDRRVTEQNKHLNTSDDGIISPWDVLTIVNFINGDQQGRTTVDDCGICGGPGRDSCGFCPNDPNRTVDLGCGCGKPPPSGCDNRCGSTLTLDQCGVCGGGGPGVCGCNMAIQPSGCDNVCGSTRTFDICGVCGGDGSSCQQLCKFYKLNVRRSQYSGHMKDDIFSGPGSDMACLQTILNNFGIAHGKITGSDWADDRLVDWIGRTFRGGSSRAGGQPQFLMDENCNPVPNNVDPREICGTLSVRFIYSPISLLLGEKQEIDRGGKIVNFKLNPYSENDIIVWRGSEDAPLLVYDPSKTGKVTSGSQLFGNWTFGGKFNFASLSDPKIPTNISWENGFEALKTLDRNNDGVLEGSELESLSLWFDKNQDAISQEGEVKPIKQVGISKLHIKDIQQVNDLRDIGIKDGYVRNVDGDTKTGAMIDWYTRSYSTAEEALAFEALRSFEGENTDKSESNDISASKHTGNPSKAEVSPVSKLSDVDFGGAWFWNIDAEVLSGDKNLSPNGLLTIRDEGEKVSGNLFVETPFEHLRENKKYRLLNIKTFEGEKFVDERTGKVGFRFSISDEGGQLSTQVFKGEQQDTLTGITENNFKPQKGLPDMLGYAWTAKKWDGGAAK